MVDWKYEVHAWLRQMESAGNIPFRLNIYVLV